MECGVVGSNPPNPDPAISLKRANPDPNYYNLLTLTPILTQAKRVHLECSLRKRDAEIANIRCRREEPGHVLGMWVDG